MRTVRQSRKTLDARRACARVSRFGCASDARHTQISMFVFAAFLRHHGHGNRHLSLLSGTIDDEGFAPHVYRRGWRLRWRADISASVFQSVHKIKKRRKTKMRAFHRNNF